MKKTLLLMGSICLGLASAAQVTFTNQGNLLQAISGTSYADCGVDMNQDGLDDVVRVMSNGIYIDYQNPDGSFTPAYFVMTIENLPSWSICAADIDGNGYTDLLLGAGDAVSFVYANDDGTAYTEDAHPEYIFTQRSTFVDIDNDGNLDSFCCHDVDQCHPYRNVNGVLELDFSLINTLDVGGNYAAIWVDYDNDNDPDLYITKCRGGAAVGDPQRINLLYRNDGNSVFTSVGPAANMNDGDQSWATVFEDFDNDGDFDSFTVNHAWANRLMRNNGDGTFTDVVTGSGINASDLGAWNCDAGDFDNDGFVDIFSEMTSEMYWNNGGFTFTGSQLSFNSGGIGDYNNDGFLDVIAGNQLWINDGNDNNYVKVDLEGIVSNKDGIGARIEIHGAWGIQIREVRAGESFDPASSLIAHFGLGTATSIDQLVVKWPSGAVVTIDNPAINVTHTITEIECLLDPVNISVSGNTTICPGEFVTLSAPEGASYTWTNDASTQSINVAQSGEYSVIVWQENGCASMSNTIEVSVIEEELPSLTVVGETMFCDGGSVIISSSVAESYQWSNGSNDQTIIITESGTYSVAVSGLCSGSNLQSESIEVVVLSAPAPAISTSDIEEPGTTTFNATGENITWYASETATDPLGTGNSIESSFFDNSITLWAESTTVHEGEVQEGGKPTIDGGGGLPSSGGKLIFDTYEPFTLVSATVNVPGTGVAGNRTFQLMDQGGNILDEVTVDIPMGTSEVNLNLDIPVGVGLQLGCVENNLFRNNAGVAYPYAIGDVGSIYNSTFGGAYYYYLYDWQIQKEAVSCTSDRVSATAIVLSTEEIADQIGLSLYPNPTHGMVTINTTQSLGVVEVSCVDAQGRIVAARQITISSGASNEWDLTNLASGVYQINVELKDGSVATRCFIKE